MYNKAILMGRICNNLEVKSTPGGVSVLTFRIAVERSYCGKNEERKTDFFNILAWRSTAEFIAKWFSKGRMILVEGELQTRTYEDKNGVTQYVTELVVDNAHFTGEAKSSEKNSLPPPVPNLANLDSSTSTAAIGESSNADFIEAAADDDYLF